MPLEELLARMGYARRAAEKFAAAEGPPAPPAAAVGAADTVRVPAAPQAEPATGKPATGKPVTGTPVTGKLAAANSIETAASPLSAAPSAADACSQPAQNGLVDAGPDAVEGAGTALDQGSEPAVEEQPAQSGGSGGPADSGDWAAMLEEGDSLQGAHRPPAATNAGPAVNANFS